MNGLKRSPWAVVAMTAVFLVFPAAMASIDVIDAELGDSFSGRIRQAGDVVQVRFFASHGTDVRVTLQASSGSSLIPSLVMRDDQGTPLEGGSTHQIGWLGPANIVHLFTAPATGYYVAEVGSSSGTGRFSGRLEGEMAPVELATVSGTVRDSLSGDVIAGAEVYVDGELFATTDASGKYTVGLPAGDYLVQFEAEEFESTTLALKVKKGESTTLDATLTPTVPVRLSIAVSGDESPGGVVTATVDIELPASASVQSIAWTQESGAAANIAGADMATATVTLGDATAYKDELVHVLTEPPVGANQLPPNVPLPPGEFVAGLQNRFQVVGINPFAREEAAKVVLKVEVMTDLGTFSDEAEVDVELPWKVSTGLRNVTIAAPVLLQGKEQGSYDWVLKPPSGSLSTLMDATSRNPYFTPDVPGRYQLDVTDQTSAARGLLTLEVHAGTWRGVIVDQDMNGRPVPSTSCTFCHDGQLAPDKFTPWAQTGHAEIFTQNLDTSTHYGPSCFPCHTVGFEAGPGSGGFDEAPDYQAFLNAGLLNNPGDNWTQVLEDFPETAQKAQIQCENCHGPQNSTGHGFSQPLGDPRVDISADVCASCHGEPLRHARFQQWQLSAHANYELAIDEGDSGNCSRCHTGNGFLTWLPILLDEDPNTDPTDDITVTWEPDETHPQTCATCHDPHAAGTISGNDPDATVRISGDTPPLIAGFQVLDVGRGAICMTCHNSRRGLHNDDVWPEYYQTSEASRAPHGSSQTDLFVGQNAYLIDIDAPGGHAGLEDTCIDCHMEATPPPAVLSYQQSGTNHTFYASTEICAECHSPHLKAEDVQNGVQDLLDQVEDLLKQGILELMDSLIQSGYTIDVNGTPVTDVASITSIEWGESRGRQAIALTFVGGAQVGLTGLNSIDVIDVDGTTVLGEFYDFADPALPKAGWNWHLVHSDGSRGVHNPFFAANALAAARDALVAAAPAMVNRSGSALRGTTNDRWGMREEQRGATRERRH